MATSKAKTIKLTDLTKVIDKAVAANAGRTLAGSTIIGRSISTALAEKIDANALARAVTKEVKAAFPDASVAAKVLIGDKLTTIGFIMKPTQ